VRALLDLVRRHRAGEVIGIYSVCSAHPLVLRAALTQAHELDGHVLIESTSNQVNQDGGYTGLRPAGFRDLVWNLADEIGLPRERVLLGGDHLGPNCWQTRPAADALERAGAMVSEYARAGFRKIHLDCTMACADDAPALSDELVASRAATLCARVEDSWPTGGGDPPVYVIGTEVPVPGGAQEALNELSPTEPEAAIATVEAHRVAFARLGLDSAWERVVGLVVQPGVEFDHGRVVDYVPAKAKRLSACISDQPHLVFEAHSTDYQPAGALAALVRDHFAILKVGPALTFALREALFALDAVTRERPGNDASAQVRATVLAAMRRDPAHWRKYYHGSGASLDLELEYSLSDRIRYYWPLPEVAQAVTRLEATFNARPPSLPLLRRHLPAAHDAVVRGEIPLRARDIVIHHIRQVLSDYSAACAQPTAPVAAGKG
jgi:D-tagatose-1,6-bisphosphate aldolase subunit GatZ/KbaZ